MKELQDIFKATREAVQKRQQAVLATVVDVRGSTYRRPGARMLVAEDGTTAGLISGGCFEQDLYERATAVMASERPQLITYDTTSSEDIIWGLGLGCAGMVYLLLEPITRKGIPLYLDHLAQCFAHQQRVVLATVFRVEGVVTAKVGSRMVLSADGATTYDLCDSDLVPQVEHHCRKAIESNRSHVACCDLPNGSADVFIEVIAPPVSLMILGAGPDAIPLVREAKHLGWHVTLVDNRPAYLTAERFPDADTRILTDPGELLRHVNIRTGDVAVVMTHNFERDLRFLNELLPSPARYIGLLGPKSKSERMLACLHEQGVNFTGEQLGRLFSPAGVDIGAETPDEIAISIVTEIQAVLAHRNATFLRERTGPIHEHHE